MWTVKCIRVSSAAAVLIGLFSLGGCATSSSHPPKEMVTPAKEGVPPAVGSPVHIRPRPLTTETEKRLSLCAQEGSCDRLHFMTALSALQSNPDAAAVHFREVIRTAPKTPVANLSKAWLGVLEGSSKSEEKQVVMETMEWLLLQLLNREKQVEELSKQLNALKLVDLEMKERTSRMKPRINPLPKPESAP